MPGVLKRVHPAATTPPALSRKKRKVISSHKAQGNIKEAFVHQDDLPPLEALPERTEEEGMQSLLYKEKAPVPGKKGFLAMFGDTDKFQMCGRPGVREFRVKCPTSVQAHRYAVFALNCLSDKWCFAELRRIITKATKATSSLKVVKTLTEDQAQQCDKREGHLPIMNRSVVLNHTHLYRSHEGKQGRKYADQ